jgi:hypothetical protein
MTSALAATALYELRLCQPYLGRMPDLLVRFRDQLPALFTRHGNDCCSAWLARGEMPRPAYLMWHVNHAAREKAYSATG